MAVRQYVGARYVPKFYEFNNGVWQSNTEYEPLTIVQYNGNSYTSKKSVPANIGNPSENGDYWAATGNYNAQVEAYRQEVVALGENVDDLSETVEGHTETIGSLTNRVGSLETTVGNHTGRIEALEDLVPYHTLVNKKILIVGDSISIETGWVSNFRTIVSANGCTVDNISVAGATIADHDNVSGLASQFIARTVENYDIIILFGGTNDALISVPIGTGGNNKVYFTDAVKAIGNKINNSYKSAQVFCVLPLKRNLMDGIERYIPLNFYRSVLNYYATLYSWNIIDGTQAPRYQLNSTAMRDYYSDGVHPNDAYKPILAKFIIDSIEAGGTGVSDYINNRHLAISDANFEGVIDYSIDMHGNVNLSGALTMKTSGFHSIALQPNTIAGFSSIWCPDINDNNINVPNSFDASTGILSFAPATTSVNHIVAFSHKTQMPLFTPSTTINY